MKTGSLSDKLVKGVSIAVQRLIEQTKRENGQLVISKGGKVVYVNASDLK